MNRLTRYGGALVGIAILIIANCVWAGENAEEAGESDAIQVANSSEAQVHEGSGKKTLCAIAAWFMLASAMMGAGGVLMSCVSVRIAFRTRKVKKINDEATL